MIVTAIALCLGSSSPGFWPIDSTAFLTRLVNAWPIWRRSQTISGDGSGTSRENAIEGCATFEIGLEGATIDERLLAGQGSDVNAISGKIQPATLARIQTPELQERAISADAYCVTYMGMDTTQAPFDKLEVRQAMNYAIDRTSLQTASGGNQLALPATTIIPDAVNGHKDFDLYPSEGNNGDPDKTATRRRRRGWRGRWARRSARTGRRWSPTPTSRSCWC